MIFNTKAWHSRGQRFDPAYLHQKANEKAKKSVKSYDFTDFFLHSISKLLWEKATVLELYLN